MVVTFILWFAIVLFSIESFQAAKLTLKKKRQHLIVWKFTNITSNHHSHQVVTNALIRTQAKDQLHQQPLKSRFIANKFSNNLPNTILNSHTSNITPELTPESLPITENKLPPLTCTEQASYLNKTLSTLSILLQQVISQLYHQHVNQLLSSPLKQKENHDNIIEFKAEKPMSNTATMFQKVIANDLLVQTLTKDEKNKIDAQSQKST